MWRDVLLTAGGAVASLLLYMGGRFTVRSAHDATREARDAEWNAAYRASAEQHLGWDWMIVGRLQRVEQQLGIDEHIPPPPPLFPPSTDPERKT